MEFPKPTKEHLWLQRLIGRWESTTPCHVTPDAPETIMKGVEVVSALGELWVIGAAEGDSPGGSPFRSQVTLGFDPARNVFVGSWVGSIMTHLWVYEGTLDETGRVLTLSCDGPDWTNPGKTAKYRDVHELAEDGKTRFLRAYLQAPDGSWSQMMEATYRRVG